MGGLCQDVLSQWLALRFVTSLFCCAFSATQAFAQDTSWTKVVNPEIAVTSLASIHIPDTVEGAVECIKWNCDSTRVAFATGGTDNHTLKVRNIATGQTLSLPLDGGSCGIDWHPSDPACLIIAISSPDIGPPDTDTSFELFEVKEQDGTLSKGRTWAKGRGSRLTFPIFWQKGTQVVADQIGSLDGDSPLRLVAISQNGSIVPIRNKDSGAHQPPLHRLGDEAIVCEKMDIRMNSVFGCYRSMEKECGIVLVSVTPSYEETLVESGPTTYLFLGVVGGSSPQVAYVRYASAEKQHPVLCIYQKGAKPQVALDFERVFGNGLQIGCFSPCTRAPRVFVELCGMDDKNAAGIWCFQLEKREAIRVRTRDTEDVFASPDGSRIACRDNDSSIEILSVP